MSIGPCVLANGCVFVCVSSSVLEYLHTICIHVDKHRKINEKHWRLFKLGLFIFSSPASTPRWPVSNRLLVFGIRSAFHRMRIDDCNPLSFWSKPASVGWFIKAWMIGKTQNWLSFICMEWFTIPNYLWTLNASSKTVEEVRPSRVPLTAHAPLLVFHTHKAQTPRGTWFPMTNLTIWPKSTLHDLGTFRCCTWMGDKRVRERERLK